MGDNVAQEHTSPLDPDEKPAAGNEDRCMPELPAPSPRLSPDEPLSGPVTLADVDLEIAKERLQYPFAIASSVYPELDAQRIALLVEAGIDRICSRAAAGHDDAISVSELAALAGIASGAEDLLASPLPQFAQLVIRAIFAQAGNRVFYEQYESHTATTGRKHNGEGSEKVTGIARNQLHLLQHNLAGSNRHCSIWTRPLNMGTRWARSCDRFGNDFPDWAVDRGSFADGFSEHLREGLSNDREVRSRVLAGLESGQIALAGPITGKRLLAAIAHHLLIGPIPFGTSLVPHRAHHDSFAPGRDVATVEEAVASGRTVALACGQLTTEERLAFEEDAEILLVGQLPSMYMLGISQIPSVQYRWSPSRHELARYSAGEGARVDCWRLVGVEKDEHFWRAMTTVERHAQVTWTKECTGRYEAECLPGKLQPHLPEQCAGVRALLNMANGGIVDAIRRARPIGS
jgi:hypothetical protein